MRLDSLVTRRRRWVLVVWLLALAAAVPFAMQQSDNLSSGGFGVPGSQSQAVADALGDFRGVEKTSLAIVLIGDRADLAEVRRQAAGVDRVQAIGRPESRGDVTVVPLRVNATDDEATDDAATNEADAADAAATSTTTTTGAAP